ncbi:DUF4335 domain-containing protein [Myxacorys almedinensis]|uniref:DUF4335 domain-containing protein n=1 Tax=Myxacorys almedinensis A TaxID=2690445 RepID=A0A8J7YZ94_9CYAN|nr:DUF4335 domain-containing protein [Myxacorys almedinensis]NDJ17279.1 DUF4335 domain-containing protein [Myxacorys almedinensis A]
MTIQRQYSLPNCTLVLEGLSDQTDASEGEMRPVMSLLINAECHLPGQEKPLLGGREFFESLVTAVSLYAQEFLSGLHLPRHTYSDRPSFVKLERLDRNHHRLSVDPDENNTMTAQQVVNLTTVQLFDLVEAIDQFVADTQTLPFWSLNLAPVPKRYVKSPEPIAKQAIPATIGLSGLALAALAFVSLPAPKVRVPECLTPEATDCPGALNPSEAATSPPSPSVSPSASPFVSPSEAASPSPEASAASPAPDLVQLEQTLNSASAITDPQELDAIAKRLYDQINGQWKTSPRFTENLEYRLGVAKNGDIVGYKAETDAALKNVGQTPLLELLYIPTSSAPVQEAIAQYKVVFTPQGKLEIAPTGSSIGAATPSVTPSPSAVPAMPGEITDKAQLEDLQPKVYDVIDQNWRGTPPFDRDLVYRVRVKADGSVVDYQPDSQIASDYVKDTPLAQLGKPSEPNAEPQEPVASFKVVFKPSGVLQVNPWYGLQTK